jgi:hypothetical protein
MIGSARRTKWDLLRNELSRYEARLIAPPRSGLASCLVIPSLLPERQVLKRHILRRRKQRVLELGSFDEQSELRERSDAVIKSYFLNDLSVLELQYRDSREMHLSARCGGQ